jgi:hypothetical protein
MLDKLITYIVCLYNDFVSSFAINLKPSVNIYYGFVLQERIFQNNIASMAKWREVHINDSMFIEDLLKWRQWHSINIITHRNLC